MANIKKQKNKQSKSGSNKQAAHTREAGRRKTGYLGKLKQRCRDLRSRRPHRSFKLTRRRDYKRSLNIPGYWALTVESLGIFWKNRQLFLGIAVVYMLLMIMISGVVSQEAYSHLKSTVDEASKDGLGSLVAIGSVFWSVFLGQISGGQQNINQQSISLLSGLFLWLSSIWLVRAILAKKRPKARDAIYNSGSPVVALSILVFILLLQLTPAAIAIIVYGVIDSSGLLAQTPILMLAGGISILAVVLSIYWITSTFIAMIIVTIPGVYPMEAIRLSGDLVVGRRLRVLLRLSWLVVVLMLMWLFILVPMILLDSSLKQVLPDLGWLPLVPFTALLMATLSIIIAAIYIYSFYRKMVADGSDPA